MSGSRAALGLACALACAACNPYQRFGKDDDALGPVDPVNFPPANLGAMGNRMRPGVGAFSEITAFVGGAPAGYFTYPMVTASAPTDVLRLREEGTPYTDAFVTPTAYQFDPGCAAPPGYVYDLKSDEVHYDVQGSIFTALPSATYTPGVAVSSRYVPVVAAARAKVAGVPCQKIKSEEALGAAVGKAPDPDGTYQAWLIIDPAAPVYPREDPKGAKMVPVGVGLQSWGWYRRYLVAYLDGGAVPTAELDVNDGTMTMPDVKKVVRMVPQKLYLPRSMVMTSTGMAAGRLGAGYDVLTARRGEPGYSPLCEVTTYDAGMPLAPDALPRDAKTIQDTFGGTLQPGTSPRYVFCLQVVRP